MVADLYPRLGFAPAGDARAETGAEAGGALRWRADPAVWKAPPAPIRVGWV
jgi:hypothetical protein